MILGDLSLMRGAMTLMTGVIHSSMTTTMSHTIMIEEDQWRRPSTLISIKILRLIKSEEVQGPMTETCEESCIQTLFLIQEEEGEMIPATSDMELVLGSSPEISMVEPTDHTQALQASTIVRTDQGSLRETEISELKSSEISPYKSLPQITKTRRSKRRESRLKRTAWTEKSGTSETDLKSIIECLQILELVEASSKNHFCKICSI